MQQHWHDVLRKHFFPLVARVRTYKFASTILLFMKMSRTALFISKRHFYFNI